MNCYECALANETVAAVAVCRHCGVGLCLEHLRKAQVYRVGGTLYGCTHQLAEVGRPWLGANAAEPSGRRSLGPREQRFSQIPDRGNQPFSDSRSNPGASRLKIGSVN